MNKRKFSVFVLIYSLIITFITVSCSSDSTVLIDQTDFHDDSEIIISNSEDLLSFYKDNSVNSPSSESLTAAKKQLEGLIYILEPSFYSDSTFFIGSDNTEYIKDNLLYPENKYSLMSVGDWNKIISILFTTDINEDLSILKYLPGYEETDFINRQDAISSIMKLLISIPCIEIEEDTKLLHKSYVLTDLDELSEKDQAFVLNAFSLGFTDLTIDSSKKFRPNEYLSTNEAASILYRIFANLGFPVNQLN